MAGAGLTKDAAASKGGPKRKPGTVVRDLRRHHLLLTQEEFAAEIGVNKRTVKRVELRESVRESTRLKLIRTLDRLLSKEHGAPIRLAVSDVFGADGRALLGVDRELPPDVRARQRKLFVAQLLKKRVTRAVITADT